MIKNLFKQLVAIALVLSLITSSNVYNNVYANEEKILFGEEFIATGECGDLFWAIYMNRVLTITGEGEYDDMSMEWMFYVDDVEHIVVDVQGISIVDRMFSGMTNVKTVDLSQMECESLVSAEDMFEDCTALETIKCPVGLTVDITLPEAKWQDTDNNTYTILPKNAQTSPVIFINTLSIRGFQYNCNTNGFRMISIIDSEIAGLEVVENGLILGVESKGVEESDLVIDSANPYVSVFAATQIGDTSWLYGNLEGASYYTMTMEGIPLTKQWLETKIQVRAYAKLSDGKYVYSDVATTSVYSVAKTLYDKVKMDTKEKHNYLYENIISVCTPNYPEWDYDWGPIVEV